MSLLLDALKQAEDNKKKSSNQGGDLPEGTIEIEAASLVLEEPELPQENSGNVEAIVKETDDVEERIQSEQPEILQSELKKQAASLPLDPALNVFAAGGARKNARSARYGLLGILLLVIMLVSFLFWQGGDSSSDSASVDDSIIEGDEGAEVVNESTPITLAKLVNSTHELAVEKTKLELEQEVIGLTKKVDEYINIEDPSPITIKKSRVNGRLSLSLSKGYAALQEGRYKEAEIIYESVLIKWPKQVDALLGLANIYAESNALNKARRKYEEALTIEPANNIAQLGLLYTYQSDHSTKGIELLQGLSSKYPENANVLVAIGHKLAKKSKWFDAQQYYFKAYSAQPDNALLAYNLAVSLDRMEKYSAAISFYNKALTLNLSSSPVISSSDVRNRISDLEYSR